jgi:hypothetical protein
MCFLLDRDAREFDPRRDIELAECLPEMEVDRVPREVRGCGGLSVRHSVDDEIDDPPLGIGQARPTFFRPRPLGACASGVRNCHAFIVRIVNA